MHDVRPLRFEAGRGQHGHSRDPAARCSHYSESFHYVGRQSYCNAELRENNNLALQALLDDQALRQSIRPPPTSRPELLNPRTSHRAPSVSFRECEAPAVASR